MSKISYRRPAVLTGIVCICLLLLTACGTSNGNTTAATVTPSPTVTTEALPTSTPTPTVSLVLPITVVPQGPAHKIGEQVKVSNLWLAVLTGVKTSAGDSITQPKSGDTILVLDLTLKNISSHDLQLSSITNFILQDSTGERYAEAFVVSDVRPPDANVQAGASLTGRLTYEVPLAQHKYTLIFIGDFTNTSNDDVVAWNVSFSNQSQTKTESLRISLSTAGLNSDIMKPAKA